MRFRANATGLAVGAVSAAVGGGVTFWKARSTERSRAEGEAYQRGAGLRIGVKTGAAALLSFFLGYGGGAIGHELVKEIRKPEGSRDVASVFKGERIKRALGFDLAKPASDLPTKVTDAAPKLSKGARKLAALQPDTRATLVRVLDKDLAEKAAILGEAHATSLAKQVEGWSANNSVMQREVARTLGVFKDPSGRVIDRVLTEVGWDKAFTLSHFPEEIAEGLTAGRSLAEIHDVLDADFAGRLLEKMHSR